MTKKKTFIKLFKTIKTSFRIDKMPVSYNLKNNFLQL